MNLERVEYWLTVTSIGVWIFYALLIAGILCACVLELRGIHVDLIVRRKFESAASSMRGAIGLIEEIKNLPANIINH